MSSAAASTSSCGDSKICFMFILSAWWQPLDWIITLFFLLYCKRDDSLSVGRLTLFFIILLSTWRQPVCGEVNIVFYYFIVSLTTTCLWGGKHSFLLFNCQLDDSLSVGRLTLFLLLFCQIDDSLSLWRLTLFLIIIVSVWWQPVCGEANIVFHYYIVSLITACLWGG